MLVHQRVYICQLFSISYIRIFFFWSSQVTNSVIFQRGRSTTNQVKLMVQHYFFHGSRMLNTIFEAWDDMGAENLGKTPNPTRWIIVFRIWATKMASRLPHSLPFYLTTLDFDSQLKHDFFGFRTGFLWISGWISLDLDFWMDFELDFELIMNQQPQVHWRWSSRKGGVSFIRAVERIVDRGKRCEKDDQMLDSVR